MKNVSNRPLVSLAHLHGVSLDTRLCARLLVMSGDELAVAWAVCGASVRVDVVREMQRRRNRELVRLLVPAYARGF